MNLILSNKKGFSLIEVIIAITIFALVAAGLTMLALGSFDGFNSSIKRSEAANFLNEGLVGSQAVAQMDWDALKYSSSGITKESSIWSLKGEGTSDSYNGISRVLKFEDLCHSADGRYENCTSANSDGTTKKVTIEINWVDGFGRSNSLQKITILRNPKVKIPQDICATPPNGFAYSNNAFNNVFDKNSDGVVNGSELDKLCAGGLVANYSVVDGSNRSWNCGNVNCLAYWLNNGSIATTTTAVNIFSVTSTSSLYVGKKYLAKDAKDNLYVFYRVDKNLYLVRSHDGGISWQNPELISSDYGIGLLDNGMQEMVVDNDGNIHLAWSAMPNATTKNRIFYRKYNVVSKQWGAIVDFSSLYNVGTEQNSVVLTLDNSNNPHIMWLGNLSNNSRKVIHYAYYSGSSWIYRELFPRSGTIYSTYVHAPASMVFDSSGKIHLVYVLYQAASEMMTNLAYSTIAYPYNTSKPSAEKIIVSSSALGKYIGAGQLAIDSLDTIHLTFQAGGASAIYYKKYSAGSWSTTNKLISSTNENLSSNPTISLDSSNHVHIVWDNTGSDGMNNVNKVTYSNNTWSTKQVIFSATNHSNGTPVLLWSKNSGNILPAGFVSVWPYQNNMKLFSGN